MKQVVFLLDSYHPYYSAVSRCLGNLAEVLEGDYQITVICQKDRPEQAEREQFGEQKLIRIGTFWSKMRLCVEQNLRLCGKKASAETENAAKESIKKAN